MASIGGFHIPGTRDAKAENAALIRANNQAACGKDDCMADTRPAEHIPYTEHAKETPGGLLGGAKRGLGGRGKQIDDAVDAATR